MFDVIIAASGKSERAGIDKLSFDLDGISVLNKTINAFQGIDAIDKIIVVTDRDIDIPDIIVTKGGATRAESVARGLELVTAPYVLIHDGARAFVSKELILRVMHEAFHHNSAIPCLKPSDSVRLVREDRFVGAFDRDSLALVQTPQGFKTELIKKAYELDKSLLNTDESELFAKYIEPPFAVEGEISNRKITYFEDLININSRVGIGYDTHFFEDGKPLVLGGVSIPYPKGLKAHSDGDAVIHAIMDALLSAAGERDIGVHFPDSDEEYKNIDSAVLLQKVVKILENKNAGVVNVAVTILAQKPKLAPFIPSMCERLAELLKIPVERVSVAATTTENLGIIGEGRAIAAIAVVNVI